MCKTYFVIIVCSACVLTNYHESMREQPAMSEANKSEGQPPEKQFWEGPYPTIQAHLKREENLKVVRSGNDQEDQRNINRRNELVEKIEKMAQQLKEEGYLFELTDDRSEYTLRVKGFEGIEHITKVDDAENVDIKGIIFDRITNPSEETM